MSRLAALSFVVLWSTGYVVARLAIPYAPPLTFLVWRFGFAVALLLMAIAWAQSRPAGQAKLQWPSSVRQGVNIAIAGLLVHAGYLSCVWVAIKLGMPAALSALIVNLQPLIVAAAGRWLGEQVSGRQWFGLVLGFVGVALTVGDKLRVGEGSVATVSLCVAALAAITAGTLWQKRRCPPFDLRVGSLIQYAASWLVVAPLAWWFEPGQELVWNSSTVSAMLWSVVMLSFAAIFLMFRLIERGAASQVFAYFYLVPPTTAVLAWVWFGERMSIWSMAGFVVAAAGVALATRIGQK